MPATVLYTLRSLHAISLCYRLPTPLDCWAAWLSHGSASSQYIIGWQFHVWAVRSLRHGAANMYVLISLGTNAAYIYSVFAMIYYRVRNEPSLASPAATLMDERGATSKMLEPPGCAHAAVTVAACRNRRMLLQC